MPGFIQIHSEDNVAVALTTVASGTVFEGITAMEEIPQGHKMAMKAIAPEENVVKYGLVIGHATQTITPGSWVHTHNMATNLAG